MSMARQFLWMERSSKGQFKLCTTTAQIRDCLKTNTIAGILHMEGAEAIDENLDNLYAFHALGLRSLGPVWSRPTIFGHGVPFAFPSSPDTGEGLTDAGKRLIRACNDLKIMIDLSHINEAGFNDVAALTDAPLVATHSNAHAITPSSRNLTDRQLHMIRDSPKAWSASTSPPPSCAATANNRAIWAGKTCSPISITCWNNLGEDHLGLGSDFDGATLPNGIGDVTGLPALQQAMLDHGYGQALMQKLCYDNWLALLDRTWGVDVGCVISRTFLQSRSSIRCVKSRTLQRPAPCPNSPSSPQAPPPSATPL